MYTSGMLYVHCVSADTEFCCGWLQEVVEAAALVVTASVVGDRYIHLSVKQQLGDVQTSATHHRSS